MCHSKGCCEKGGCTVSSAIKTLLVIGGINWGLVGVGMLMGRDWNVVNMIFGALPTLEAIIYILVGIAAVMKIFGCKCKKCVVACGSCGPENHQAEGAI